MIVYVAGSRVYSDRKRLKEVLDNIHHSERPITTIVEGGNLGAHRIAQYWAGATGGIKTKRFEPIKTDDCGHRRAARDANRAALDFGVELVVAFPGGFRTKDLIAQAKDRGVPVRMIDWE